MTVESMTFSSLVEDVKNYAERSDQPFANQIPRMVMLAENRIATEVKGLGQVKFVTGQFTAGSGVIQKPARWRETVAVSYSVGGRVEFLRQRGYTFCRSYWPDGTATAPPEYYCDYDYEHLLVVGTPDEDYPFEICYFERPLPLSTADQTNWTTRYAPQLLLYATLLEAQPFLKRPERIAEFQALFDRAAAAVNNEAQRRLQGDNALVRTVG